MVFIPAEFKKTEEMKRFEAETGKKAIWQERVTAAFKKWQKGEKIYNRKKDRLGIYLSTEDKEDWLQIAKEKGDVNLSQLIRDAVNHYASCNAIEGSILSADLMHDIRNPLTALKGYADLLMNVYGEKLDANMRKRVQGIIDKSKEIDEILIQEFEHEYSGTIKSLGKGKTTLAKDTACDILIIDDDPDTREFMVEYLEFMKYTCQVLPDGSNIIEKLGIIQPRVVLLDIYLPIMNGIEVCKNIRASENYKDLPVYFITAAPESDVKEFVKQVDVNGYFIKPFEIKYLDKLKQHVPH
ncbi:MAG: response regulator [Candidatus Hodarchaeota archaeon]